MKKIILFTLILSGFRIIEAQETVPYKKLLFDKGQYNYNNILFTGTAFVRKETDIAEYYQYTDGKKTAYIALYPNGDTAGVHRYSGNDIHLVFYTKDRKKNLEYNQRVLDQTYTYGEWKDFHPNGTLQVKGNYALIDGNFEQRGGIIFEHASVRDGSWEYYDTTGKLIKTENWNNNKLIETKYPD